MRVTVFTHSLVSCWNHGNAHFLRGVLRALQALGHETCVWEPADSWSRENLLLDQGKAGLVPFADAYPDLASRTYAATVDVDAMLDSADLVLVHEWSDPALVAAIGRARAGGGRFRLLFHDTHHRAVSDPAAMRAFDLSGYDGVLAFGAALAEVYRGWGWGDRVFVWHEAADTTLFRPSSVIGPRDGLVWIGNWGDGERTAELDEYLLRPAARVGVALDIHGVRYPDEALAMLDRAGARYRGWIANPLVPGAFARHRATVHVPRGFYAGALPGIPTIRVFEALACGIPLLSAPWSDTEGLFRIGTDFLMPRSGEAMERAMRHVLHDDDLAASLARSGLATIRARHTCDHRARELLSIAARLDGAVERKVA